MKDDYPNFRPISAEPLLPLTPAVEETKEESKTPTPGPVDKDLRILAITWNMGGSQEAVFQT